MIRFLVRRTILAAILVFGTLTVTCLIIDIAPGDPLTRFYAPGIDSDAMDTVRQQLGLDDPLPVRYLKTLGSFRFFEQT